MKLQSWNTQQHLPNELDYSAKRKKAWGNNKCVNQACFSVDRFCAVECMRENPPMSWSQTGVKRSTIWAHSSSWEDKIAQLLEAIEKNSTNARDSCWSHRAMFLFPMFLSLRRETCDEGPCVQNSPSFRDTGINLGWNCSNIDDHKATDPTIRIAWWKGELIKMSNEIGEPHI